MLRWECPAAFLVTRSNRSIQHLQNNPSPRYINLMIKKSPQSCVTKNFDSNTKRDTRKAVGHSHVTLAKLKILKTHTNRWKKITRPMRNISHDIWRLTDKHNDHLIHVSSPMNCITCDGLSLWILYQDISRMGRVFGSCFGGITQSIRGWAHS